MHAAFRNITEREALEQAKAFLTELDNVYFFEDMLVDFPRLWREVFPHVTGNSWYGAAYFLGALAGWPRMHVRKYQAHLRDVDKEALRKANLLDIELYSWARKHFGKAPLVMFDTYEDMAVQLTPLLALIVACMTCVCVLAVRVLENGKPNRRSA
jgi:hypothetical protein